MKRITATLALFALTCGPTLANTCTALQAGATDQTVYLTFLDATTGVPNSGLAFNSSGIDLEYVRAAAAAVDITEVTQTAAGAHTDGGFVSVGHGRYRLDLPDAAVATGVPFVLIQGVITGYVLAPCTVALSPPANAVQIGGTTQTGRDIGASVLLSNGTGTGQIVLNSGRVNADVVALSGDTTAADNAEAFFDGTGYAGTNNTIPTVTTLTNAPSDSSGTTTLLSRIGTPTNTGGGATIAANLADIEAQTDDIGAAGAGLTAADDSVMSRLGTPAGASMSADIAAIEDQTDDIGAAGAGLTAADDAVMTRLGTPAGASVSADVAAVKSDSAAILDDTGTTGVLIAEAVGNCREVLGCDTQGTLTGSPTSLTADLGTNAPTQDISGMTLVIPAHNFSRQIDSYDTGTGVATWVDATGATLASGNQYYVWATPVPPAASGGGLDAAGVRAALGMDAPDLDSQLDAIKADTAAILVDTGTTLDDLVDDLESRLGTPTNTGGGATIAANLADIEAQTDDIGAAGAGLTAADDAVMTRLGTPAGASVSADIAAIEDQTDDIGVAGAGLTAADDSVMSRLGTPAGVSVSADIAAIEAQTDDIGTAGAGLTALAWNSAWDAEVQSEAADALTAIYLDQLFASTYNPASKPGAADALLNELVESDAGVARFTTNALENGPAGGGGGTSDWSTGEKEQIRHRLGIDGSATAPTATPSLATAAAVTTVSGYVDTLESVIGTPSNTGSGATVAANLADIEAQTDDIGVAGAGLTAADDSVMSRLGTPAGASIAADITAQGVDVDAILDDLASQAIAIAEIPADVLAETVEPNGSVNMKCVLRALFAVAAGDVSTTDNASTFSDPTGAADIVSGTAPTPGNRNSTVVCP